MPVLFPTSDGLTFDQTEHFLTQVLTSTHVIGMSIACYHPNLDVSGEAGKRITEIISNSVGKIKRS